MDGAENDLGVIEHNARFDSALDLIPVGVVKADLGYRGNALIPRIAARGSSEKVPL